MNTVLQYYSFILRHLPFFEKTLYYIYIYKYIYII